MDYELARKAQEWVKNLSPGLVEAEYYCETRDHFQARLDKMLNELLRQSEIPADEVYILAAMAGEIGNNSFDHNLGSWPDVPGIFFGHALAAGKFTVVLADRGRGVFATLKRVKPELKSDAEALLVAFNEKLSGRAPEPRGNGLKFVKENIIGTTRRLIFRSGEAQAELNDQLEIKSTEKIKGCLAVLEN